MDPRIRSRSGSGSTPKCHGSATLPTSLSIHRPASSRPIYKFFTTNPNNIIVLVLVKGTVQPDYDGSRMVSLERQRLVFNSVADP
jgi:hypothetical protein